MKSNREAPFTRKQGKSAGISLSWRKELNTDNPIEASTSGGAVVEPVQQSSSEQELNTVSICEPLDEINLEEEFDDNLAWDHSGDIQSPQGGNISPVVGDSSNLEGGVNSSRWSTAFNRINTTSQPDITPERLPVRQRLQGTSEQSEEEVDLVDEEQLDSREVDEVIVKMDEEAYKKRSADFKKLFREVEDSISDFTAEDVFVQNLDACEGRLSQITNKFIALRVSLREFYDEFDAEAHPDWETQWEEKLNLLSAKYKANDREIRTKIDRIKGEEAQAIVNNVNNGRHVGDVESTDGDNMTREDVITARAEIERTDLIACLKELQAQIDAIVDCTALEDFDVMKYLKQSVSWKSDMKILDKRNVELQKTVVMHPFSPEAKSELVDLHTLVKSKLSSVVTSLEEEDSSRKLYTNSRSHAKDPVPYPFFKSRDDEDVHKFLKDFKEALVRNQIPVKDQVKILRNNLKNFALEVVHKDITDIEVAYKSLIKHFGNSDKIWGAKFKVFLDECEKRWPLNDHSPKERFQKLSKLISQLEELESLIDSGSVDKAELYNASSIKKLFNIIPNEITNKVFEITDDESTNEDKIKNLKGIMLKFRNTAQQKMMMEITGDKELIKEKIHYGEQKNLCFFCKEDWNQATHIKEWGIFGCSKLLKMTHDERRTALVKKNLCFACGYPRTSKSSRDPRNHKCRSIPSELMCDSDYNGSQCKYNALTCKHRKAKASMKSKIRAKLNFDLQGFNLAIFEEIITVTPIHSDQANVDLESRFEDLQLGEVAKNMDNNEIRDFFRQRESLLGNDMDKILGIPEGETLFIFCIIKGRTRSLRAFMDCGCSSWLVRNGVPEAELKSVKLRDGPIPMFVAGGHTVHATAEWASLLPLSNGHNQIIRGLSVDDVTGPFAAIDMNPIIEELKESAMRSNSPLKKMITNLKAPHAASGQTDMLLGMKHWNLFPEPLYSTPAGLTLFKNKFLTSGGGELTCIGGPSKALAKMLEQFGACQVMNMFAKISEQPQSFSTSLEYFPSQKDIVNTDYERDICRESYSDLVHTNVIDADEFEQILVDSQNPELVNVENCDEEFNCTCCSLKCVPVQEQVTSVQSVARKFLDVQDLGLKMEYRCPSCRNCLNCRRGESYEKVSIRQEAEQCLIRESIWIDPTINRAIAKLPFRMNPIQALTNNRGVTVKMLDRVCTKYLHDKDVVELIMKAFNKLYVNGHIKFLDELSKSDLNLMERAPVSYYIPWDIAFSGSISTPARPTFNASKNTPGGTNLNDILAKGIPNLVNLLHMTIGWISGPQAICGDISQFYNVVLLHPDHYPYQRFVFRENLDPNSKLLEGIIVTLIYGVASVSAQTEELINLIADEIHDTNPIVADFLRKSRYVDDFAKAVEDTSSGCKIIEGVNHEFGKFNLEVKGWAQSGSKPPDQISKDGKTITFAGIAW